MRRAGPTPKATGPRSAGSPAEPGRPAGTVCGTCRRARRSWCSSASADDRVRGSSAEERIVHGTGGIVAREVVAGRAAELPADPRVAFVDIRSARNCCFLARARRAQA
ncbi:DUF1203 domain-containing protein [Roseicyclus sp.]|uniref:DUF1203 domain-containing protein n=1 Tax=Roseicyclus sp. TaxID=1914329 RepID=UPI003FA07F6E